VEQLRFRRQSRDRRVGAHGADGLLAALRHRRHQKLDALLRVAERLLQIEQADVGLRRRRLRRQRQLGHLDLRALEPDLIRMAGGDLGLQFVVGNDAAFFQIDQKHLARLQAPFLDDVFFGNRQHAGFRRHDHRIVLGDEIAGRPQTVAVERRADLAAVGEGHGGRAVPRLHQTGMIFVKGAALAIHGRIAGPGFGNQHHRRVREAVSSHGQEFERVVQTGRIALVLVHDGKQFLHVLAEQFGVQPPLPCAHPIHIALQRVDFAVVANVAIGMGQRPGREGIRAESRVHEGQAARHAAVGQVLIVLGNLMRK